MAVDQIRLLRTLFKGRDDAYGLETPNGYKAIQKPLTDDLLRAHLDGRERIGVYPFFKEGIQMENRLRVIRAEKRITQFQLRLQTGINATKISFIENGLVEPRPDEMRKLARSLGVNPQELFVEESR